MDFLNSKFLISVLAFTSGTIFAASPATLDFYVNLPNTNIFQTSTTGLYKGSPYDCAAIKEWNGNGVAILPNFQTSFTTKIKNSIPNDAVEIWNPTFQWSLNTNVIPFNCVGPATAQSVNNAKFQGYSNSILNYIISGPTDPAVLFLNYTLVNNVKPSYDLCYRHDVGYRFQGCAIEWGTPNMLHCQFTRTSLSC